MKTITFVMPELLPMPPVHGGAVETLVQFFIENNERNKLCDIIVVSKYDQAAEAESLKYKNTTFKYVTTNKTLDKAENIIKRAVRKVSGKWPVRPNSYAVNARRIVDAVRTDYIILENRAVFAPIFKGCDNVIVHLHNDYLNDTTDNMQEIVSNIRGTINISKYICSQMPDAMERMGKWAKVLPNVVDCGAFNITKEVRACEREKLGLSDQDVALVFTGRFIPEKGIRELIKAVAALPNPHIKLVAVGSAWFSSNDESVFSNELKVLSRDIQDRILFTGYVPHDEIAKILGACDIAVIPSLWDEPASLSNLEAMAAGLPIIATNAGGIPEYADDDCAIILERNDGFVDRLSKAIGLLVDDPDRRMKMSVASKRRAQMYDAGKYLKDLIDLLP